MVFGRQTIIVCPGPNTIHCTTLAAQLLSIWLQPLAIDQKPRRLFMFKRSVNGLDINQYLKFRS